MKLIKTTLYAGLATFVRISSGFISTKIIALLAGTSGVALLGAFSNFLTIILTLGNGAINNGIIKYTAEYEGNKHKTRSLFSTALKISIYCSVFIGILLILANNFFSNIIFKNTEFKSVITILGITLIFYSLNSLLIAIINGKGKIELLTGINVVGSLIGLLLTYILTKYFGIFGAIYSLILSQTLIFFFSVIFILKKRYFHISYFIGRFDKGQFTKLSSFALMAIVSAITTPISQIIIRNRITEFLDISEAGIWQGMMRISDGYLMLINTALITYYLPKLSATTGVSSLKKEVINGYRILIPILLIVSLLIYLFRFNVIRLLYNEQFLGMEVLFKWQLMGDFFKICSFILAYLMLAKAMTKTYILTEIIFSITYTVLSIMLINRYGVLGASIGFSINYLFYFALMILIFSRQLFNLRS